MGSTATKDCCCHRPCNIPPCGCCKCMCRWHCITVSSAGTDCDCTEKKQEIQFDFVTKTWHGTIVCGHLNLTYEYWFAKNRIPGDPNQGKCDLVLRSACLGYPEGSELRVPYTCNSDGSIDVTISGLDAYGCIGG